MRISDWSSDVCSSDLTTTEVNPEGDVACESKTSETSFDVHVGGVAGPAAVTFGSYDNYPGCDGPVVDGNTLTLSVFEDNQGRSEEHTSELQSLMRISYAVFCLKKKPSTNTHNTKQLLQEKQHTSTQRNTYY